VIATAEAAAANGSVAKLGFAAGQVVQEFGYDEDVDDDFRLAIEELCGSELEEEDYGDVADAVVLWWREDDGDLIDALVDGLTNLAEGGSSSCSRPRLAGTDTSMPATSRRQP